MKKIIIAVIILISANAYSFDNEYSCGINSTSGERTSWPTCAYEDYTIHDWTISGVYNYAESAMDARDARYASFPTDSSEGYGRIQSGPTCTGSGVTNGEFNTVAWCYYTCAEWRCHENVTTYVHNYYYLYPNPDWVDENEDCISDEAPEDEDYFHVSGSITDVNGTCYYYARLFTSNGNFVDYGDSSAFAKLMNGTINGTIHYNSTYPLQSSDTGEYLFDPDNYFGNIDNVLPACNYEGGLDPSDQDENSGSSEDAELSDDKDLDDGTDSSGNTTDSENIETTADNTAAIANNQQEISDQLTEIANQIKAERNDLKEKAVADGSAYDKMNKSLDDIEGSVEWQNAGVVDAYNDLGTDYDNLDMETYKTDAEFAEGDEYTTALDGMISDVSDDGTIGGVIDKYADNEVLTGFASSSISITDADCCIEVPFSAWGYETNFEINACRFESELTTIGNIFYVLCTIGCWILIIRGK